MENATDANMKVWFEARLAAVAKDMAERVRSAVDSVAFSAAQTRLVL